MAFVFSNSNLPFGFSPFKIIPISKRVFVAGFSVANCFLRTNLTYDFLGSILDDSSNHRKSFTTVALLHHHPIPVNEPEWRKKSWYERLLGDFFEQSGVMENSAEFLQWCKKRKIITILHGHKHIPRCDVHEGITVIGCGSTFGKIETKIPTQTYLSLNLVTIDTQNKKIGCRLRAERVPGAGLEEQESHELVFTKGFSEIV